MLFMVVERYKDGNYKAVYSRFHEKGRMMPKGLSYLGSWVETNYDRCFQLMECDEPSLLQAWIDRWKDLVDCEIVQVMTSSEASATALGKAEA
jgi:hypothetical protein